MKYYSLKKKILYSILVIIMLALLLIVWIFSEDKFLTGTVALMEILFLTMAYLMNRNQEQYLRETAQALCDLIHSISEPGDQLIFSDTEDTLLSKLQSQVMKLTNVLKIQHQAALSEKEAIKSLISDISHQLKTPMSTLKMYGEFLQDESASPEDKKEYLQMLQESLSKLEFLTDSLIKMSRLESHIIQMKPQAADMNDTILNVIMQCFQKAKEKNTTIAFQVSDTPMLLYHDVRWTEEAIFNMLDNAIKYSPAQSKITLELQCYDLFCKLDIKDNSAAIPETEQPKIFQRFYRGSSSVGKDGFGIGLYLSRKIITDQGGYIKVTSEAGYNVFSIFMPL